MAKLSLWEQVELVLGTEQRGYDEKQGKHFQSKPETVKQGGEMCHQVGGGQLITRDSLFPLQGLHGLGVLEVAYQLPPAAPPS